MTDAKEAWRTCHNHQKRLWLLFFWPFCLLLLVGCGASEEQLSLAERSKGKIADCKVAGDKLFKRKGKCLVWDLEKNSIHGAHNLLDGSLRYSSGEGPITVFLVSAKQNQQVGTYSISRQPGYREWMDVYVVQFLAPQHTGTALATHEVVSLDPRHRRQVQQTPEYGDPALPVADWIRSLPSDP